MSDRKVWSTDGQLGVNPPPKNDSTLFLYLGSGTAASAYGAASSLITLLLWIYYSSQILLFGAEFTQVYAARAGREFVPDEYAVRV